MTVATDTLALTMLRNCRRELRAAQLDATSAADKLYGLRRTRAEELAADLAGALNRCEQLATMVADDTAHHT